MTAYVALLRAVNVAGQRRVPMTELRALCEALGFARVATYVQSGNVVFTADASAEAVREMLEAALAERYGVAIDVSVRTREELAAIALAHPFAAHQADPRFLHVFFLAADPDPERVRALDPARFEPDELVVRGREVYVHYPNGAGRSKLAFNLGVPATARNWRTVEALLALANALE